MEKEYPGEEMEMRLLSYFNRELEEEECRAVEDWLEKEPENRKAYETFLKHYLHICWVEKEQTVDLAQGKMMMKRRMFKARRFRIYYRVAASVAILVALGGSPLFHALVQENDKVDKVEDIRPGSLRAKLVLSSGEIVDLEQGVGMIRERDGSCAKVKEKEGLVYDTANPGLNADRLLYHKIIVPRGGEFFVTLADGTSVWLNADSELEYPLRFAGNGRDVRLRGEAYFVVRKDSVRPFVVHSGDYSLQVYGTEFNLNAYKSEEIQAVLVEGSIGFKANGAAAERRLRPNQLAVANALTGASEIKDVDVASYVAWTHRDVVFVNERLESIMEKAARWYDVDVHFQSEALKELRFYGNTQRYADIEELLSLLEKISDVRFRVNGRTVMIYEK